jgi:hypothetical protein
MESAKEVLHSGGGWSTTTSDAGSARKPEFIRLTFTVIVVFLLKCGPRDEADLLGRVGPEAVGARATVRIWSSAEIISAAGFAIVSTWLI